jgi:hypothetical protein
MKVLFAGASLHGAKPDLSGIQLRPSASQGDLTRAVVEGATAIGLVDGYFETTAAVWHKEILFALSSGVQVLGAASMGALRAAECAPFGMVPVGEIAKRYVTGELDDDAAVAQLHAPEGMVLPPVTEALVDAEPTICHLAELKLISREEKASLLESAHGLFFKDRTIEAIAAHAQGIGSERKPLIEAAYRQHRISAKRDDALALIDKLRQLSNRRIAPSNSWTMSRTPEWRRTLGRLSA